jgi:hypothetical protein
VAERIDAIEESYEFMLAYAAQGATDEMPGRGVRSFLAQMAAALDGLAAAAREESARLPADLAAACAVFITVLDDDAAKALAAVNLVQAASQVG